MPRGLAAPGSPGTPGSPNSPFGPGGTAGGPGTPGGPTGPGTTGGPTGPGTTGGGPGSGVEGLVRNAATGQGIPGASVSAGGRSATTDGNGRYTLTGLAPGQTQVTASAGGFISDTANVNVPASGNATQTFGLTQALGGGQTRIVLTWGQTPRDLDSHFYAPSGGRVAEIYFGNKGNLNSAPFVNLDVDDTNGNGPETTTIGQVAPGQCAYAVYNYSDDAPLASSGARVVVYRGDSQVQSFTVPNAQGRWWHVFNMDCSSGTITPVNTVAGSPPTVAAPTGGTTGGGTTAGPAGGGPAAPTVPRVVTLSGGTGGSVLGCIPCDGQARFMGPGRPGVALGLGAGNAGEARVAAAQPAGTLRNLRVQISAADGGIWSFNVWVNGRQTPLGCAINGRTNPGQTSCDSGSATQTIQQGDRVSIGVGNPGDPITQGNFRVEWSLELATR
jgi:hypothetical protein